MGARERVGICDLAACGSQARAILACRLSPKSEMEKSRLVFNIFYPFLMIRIEKNTLLKKIIGSQASAILACRLSPKSEMEKRRLVCNISI